MSEKAKRHTAAYRRNRERWIFAQSVIVIVLTLAVLICALVSARLNKTYYVAYTESGNVDYNVFLKENEFYEEDHLGKDQTYVASLIESVVASFAYRIDMDAENVNYRYSYNVTSTLEIVENASDGIIYNPEKMLVEKDGLIQNSASNLVINEIVAIDYNDYNELATRFLQTYGLTDVESSIVLRLNVEVLSDCAAFTSSAVDSYVSELRIPLTTKTVNVEMTSTVPENDDRMIACNRGLGGEAFRVSAIVLAVVDAILILVLVAFIYLTRTEDITYTARVKRILSRYKSFIQRIRGAFDENGYQVIHVSSFDEMLEIRDTVGAPILLFENSEKTCARFYIPTDAHLLYVYEISIEGASEPAPAAAPAEVPVAAPVVKAPVEETPVVEAPVEETPALEAPAEEIAEEEVDSARVLARAIADAIDETEEENEAVVEEIPTPEEEAFLLDNSACVIVAEEDAEALAEELTEALEAESTEAAGVDAIDVQLGEDTLTCDPDGNLLEEGDVVRLPAAAEGEEEPEAEVVKGNYRVDPETLQNPLVKILAVVRRKAEQVFTAVLTPVEDETNDTEE